MASGASGEVVHCPNCKEDVPKTLYCLNCGFPLYKEEQPKEEAKPEVKAKPVVEVPAEEDAVIMVDDEEEEAVKPEEPKVEVPAPAPEIKIEAPAIETPKPVEPVAAVEVVQPEAAPEPVAEQKVEEAKAPEPTPPVVEKPAEAAPVAETPPPPIEEPRPVEAPSEPSYTGIEASEIDAVAMVEEFQATKAFVPDPLSKDLMENLARNISLKVKLVKLFRDGTVKEETFTKLYEGFAAEGKIWSSRREEMLRKLSAEIEEMEDAYSSASEALEFLEVRRSIGEASEGEYAAKAPAYRWDIDHFDNMVGEKRNKTAYLENMGNVVTDDELRELRELAGLQYNTLESLQLSRDEFLASIKDNLYEAIKILG